MWITSAGGLASCHHGRMRVPQALPSTFAEVPFTYAEALDAGISPGRIRRRSIPAPSRGIRVPNTTGVNHAAGPDVCSEIRPYTLVTQFSAASHATAFRVWKFPGLLGGFDEQVIHISRPDHMAIPRRMGVRGHRGVVFRRRNHHRGWTFYHLQDSHMVGLRTEDVH